MYRLGSEQGSINAIQNLAACFDKGAEVEQDRDEAKRLYVEISRILEQSEGIK